MGNFNSMVFPKPDPPSYNIKHTCLIEIPRPATISCSSKRQERGIPCFFLPCKDPTDKVMLYFHGNAEDIGYSEYFFAPLTQIWNCHVLVIEYPSYGVYKYRELSEKNILKDAGLVYDFLTVSLGLKPQQILIFGRSMGSGPATYLASSKNVSGLVLFSAYKSVKEAAKSLVGGFLGSFVKERFRNIDAIEHVTCPVLMIHGEKDQTIPHSHSIDLFKNCKKATWKHLITPSKMTHNEFRLDEDLIEPVLSFLKKNKIFGMKYGGFLHSDMFMKFRYGAGDKEEIEENIFN